MAQRWFIRIENRELGPFTYEELELRSDISPETPARLEGTEKWLPMWDFFALRPLFEDKEEPEEASPDPEDADELRQAEWDALVLEAQREPPNFFIWLLIILILITLTISGIPDF